MLLKKNHSIKQELFDLFKTCQSTTAVHQRNSIILKQLYENSNHEEFWSYFKHIINVLLKTVGGSKYVEKAILFIGMFCSLLKSKLTQLPDESIDSEEHPLLMNIMCYLLKTSEVYEDIVRIRSCQIINVILDSLVGSEVSEELCDKLETVLLSRLNDTKYVVRQHAVITLHRLQDPTNHDDNVIPEFIKLMNSDCHAKVRQFCIEKIAVRNDVVQHIVKRILDKDHNVRLSAFKRISKFAGFLKISEKRFVLHCGFIDKSEQVREYTSTILIKAWLEFYENNILKLMKSIRLDADEKDIENTVELFENVLKIIFQDLPPETLSTTLILNDKKLVPADKLNWEMVSFWRIYVQFLSQQYELEEELEKVIPELIHFCAYIKEFYVNMPKEVTAEEFLEQQFILKQLFLMTKTYDFGDVTNRRCLNSLVSNILENVVLTYDVTKIVVSVLEHSIPEIEKRTQYVCEIISEILYPMVSEDIQQNQQEHEYLICRLNVEITKMKHQQEDEITKQNFVEAERLKHELEKLNTNLTDLKNTATKQPRQNEKKTDPLTTVKCLDIAAAVLSCPKVDKPTTFLKTLKEDFFQELLIHENDSIRVKALKCYGLYCIIDKHTAAVGIHIFSTPIFAYQNGDECDTQTLLICISSVVDILRVYGPQLMAAPENGQLSESMEEHQQAVFEGGTSLTHVLQGLVDLMDDDQYDIQEKAGHGLCQLVLSNRIISPSLISRLILKWCNPASDSECGRLKQIIGFTLERLPLINDCADQLIDAVFITINALYAAPTVSPLADVNVENIAKFLLALCKISPKTDYIHSTVAVRLVKKMMEKPRSKFIGLYSKMLLMLEIPNKQTAVEELWNDCCTLLEVIREKSVVNNITKVTTKLNLKMVEINQTNNGTDKTQNETNINEETTIEENDVVEDPNRTSQKQRTIDETENTIFDEINEESDSTDTEESEDEES